MVSEPIERAGAQRTCRFLEPAVDIFQGDPNCANHQREGHDRGGKRRSVARENKFNAEIPLEPGTDRAAATEQQ